MNKTMSSKAFCQPYIHDAVPRKRLFARLDEQFHKPFFLITGQAAQGKTTLIASYLEKKDIFVLWINLTRDDQDHGKLFDKITSALTTAVSQAGGSKALIAGSTVLGTDKGVQRRADSLEALFSTVPFPVALVLDDLELIDEGSAGLELIHGVMQADLGIHKLLLLSRTQPGINLASLKMKQKICILYNQDLSFTLSETREFFQGKTDVKQEELEKIHRISSGWVGGLTLMSESLRQLKHLPDGLPEQLSTEAFNYFSQEIFTSLPENIREFLIHTSVLEQIDFDVAAQLFDHSLVIKVVAELEKRNLFIQRIRTESGSQAFKYHLLFKNFLLENLKQIKTHDEFKELNQTLGRIFWEKRDYESALTYYYQAQAYGDMAHIIKIKGPDYMARSHLSGLEKWISRLPGQMIDKDPWLILFLSMSRRIKGGKKNIAVFHNTLQMFEKKQDIRGMMLSVGSLIEAAVFMRKPSEKIINWIQKGESIFLSMEQKDRFTWARALLWQQIGLGYIAGTGDLPKGISACKNAILLGQQINNPGLALNASITLALGHVQTGDFANARKLLNRISNMAGKVRNPEYRALKNIVDINFALKNGRFRMVKQLLEHSESDIENFGLIFLYPGFIESKALYLAYTGQFEEARQMADHLNDFSILEGNDFYKGVSLRITAIIFFLAQDYKQAGKKVKAALQELNPSKKGDIHYYITRQLAGVILYENKEYRKADEILTPVLEYFEEISSELSCCEISFVLGMINLKLNQRQTGLLYLQKGFEKAERESYYFFPLVSEKIMADALLTQTLTSQAAALTDYSKTLLSKWAPELVISGIDQIVADTPPSKKQETLQVFSRIYKQLLPKLHIKTLGQFNLYIGDRQINQKEFGGSKPIMLLKSILLHGGTDIPKEILINDLWPDSNAKAGEKNLKVNLHRLRKAIEKQPKKEFGHSYILQKSGLISIDHKLVSIDFHQFLNIGAKAMEKENEKQFNTAIELYEKACQLYTGDFFAEEPYLEWIAHKRDQYRARYMELLGKKAMLHEDLEQIDEAIKTWQKCLEYDSCYETAYQNLMILHADAGRRKNALQWFHICEAVLEKELGVRPEQQTLNIFNRITSM